MPLAAIFVGGGDALSPQEALSNSTVAVTLADKLLRPFSFSRPRLGSYCCIVVIVIVIVIVIVLSSLCAAVDFPLRSVPIRRWW